MDTKIGPLTQQMIDATNEERVYPISVQRTCYIKTATLLSNGKSVAHEYEFLLAKAVARRDGTVVLYPVERDIKQKK